jgi:hypothetical protein
VVEGILAGSLILIAFFGLAFVAGRLTRRQGSWGLSDGKPPSAFQCFLSKVDRIGHADPKHERQATHVLDPTAADLPIRHIEREQDPAALRSVVSELGRMLTPNEEILYVVLQNATAMSVRKDAVVATNNRLIIYRPGVMGGLNLSDFLWEDVKDVTIRQGVFAAELLVDLVDGRAHAVGGLDKQQIRRFYSIAQQKEQEWREKRRVSQMETDRARAGGILVGTSSSRTAPETAPQQEDPVQRLAKAKALLDQGLISETEYEGIKARIIATL